MKRLQLKNWMFISLNGILAVLFGLVALFFPSITLVALAVYFAISILLGGLVLAIGSIRFRKSNSTWYLLLVEGVLGVLIGTIILLKPEISAAVFVTIIGLWAILLGMIILVKWYRRKVARIEKGFLLFTGILSFVFGIIITLNPFEVSRVITVLIGVYAISYGIFSLIIKNSTQ